MQPQESAMLVVVGLAVLRFVMLPFRKFIHK